MDEGPPLGDPLREGIRLFNEGYFFEAHEVWEGAWRAERGESRLFLQGLIQVAAGLHHFREGNVNGAASLVDKALGKLRRYPDEYLGLKNRDLIAYLERLGDRLRRRASGGTHEEMPPFPKLALPSGS